jgi:hypothetical protein
LKVEGLNDLQLINNARVNLYLKLLSLKDITMMMNPFRKSKILLNKYLLAK